MIQITFENNKFILHNGEKQEILLDGCNLMSNKSRLPMHALSDEETIPGLLFSLAQKHAEISIGTGEETENGLFAAYLLDILLASYLIRASMPFKVVEFGAVNGVRSYHLAALMGKLNPESSLCCVSDVIGNESGNQWLNRISIVKQPPVLSMLIADYEHTQLESDHFDIVLINGTVRIDRPYETIRETERLIKKGGVILCHAKDSFLLKSSFKLIFEECKEYEIASNEEILITKYAGTSWCKGQETNLQKKTAALVRELHQAVASDSRDKFRLLARKIDLYTNKAVETYDIKLKTELIRLKERLLDYMLNSGDEFEGLYKERLQLVIADNTID